MSRQIEPSDVDEWQDNEGDDDLALEGPLPQVRVDDDLANEGPVGLHFSHVEAFVSGFLADAYRRSLDGRTRTWCPAWWKHAEAISRLEAMWRAWEYLRREPALGMSTWWRDHADPHMAVLLSAEGPFRGCDPEKGHSDRLKPLPLDQPPEGLFCPS